MLHLGGDVVAENFFFLTSSHKELTEVSAGA